MALTVDERLDMLQRASRAWLELRRLVDAIPDAALERPGTIGSWSGRDLLAHIASWEREGARVIRDLDAGEPAEWPNDSQTDAWNEAQVEGWRSLRLEQVQQWAQDEHFELMNLAETSPEIAPDILLSVTAEHYAEHLDDVRKLAKNR